MTPTQASSGAPIVVLFPDGDARSRLERELAAIGSLVSYDAPRVFAVAVHTGFDGWAEATMALRERVPSARVVVQAADVASAALAVNSVGVDLLIAGAAGEGVADAIEQLLDSRVPTGVERMVQTRTEVLQRAKQQWELSFDALSDPLALMDEELRVLRVNRAYAEHIGIDIRLAPGQHCYALRSASPRAFAAEPGQPCSSCPAAAASGSRSRTVVLPDTSGRRWVVGVSELSDDSGPRRLLVHYRDATREASRLMGLAQTDKLAAIGKLSGAIAHEMNSPMTAIMVFSEAIQRKTDPQSELHEHAVEINQSAQRCRVLIRGLLQFARRRRSTSSERVMLGELVAGVQPLVQHRVDMAGVTLKIDLPQTLSPVLAAWADIEHVLVNLITNAVEACQRGATITISGRTCEAEHEVELSVRDTGRGMSEQELLHAFDPFFTSRQEEGAAGLGLAISEAVLAGHGGRLALESRVDEGTRAQVRLPMAD